MRMTALDVQNHVFPRRLKGYDVDEVEQFRTALVEDWTAVTQEADALRKRVAELEARVQELTSHENALRDAMVTAQGMSDELRRTAEHEAQMRVGQAELQAEKILAAAHRQATRLAQDVRELRTLRSRMAGTVRATIETHLALLEGFSRDPQEELGDDLEARLGELTARVAATADACPIEIGTAAPSEPAGDAAAPARPREAEAQAAPPPHPGAEPSRGRWKVLLGQG